MCTSRFHFASSLRALVVAVVLGCAAFGVHAGPVLSPAGQHSILLRTTNPVSPSGSFLDEYSFTLAVNASLNYVTHRDAFPGADFSDFHAFLYQGDGQLIATGIDAPFIDPLYGLVGYSNRFFIPELAAGEYRLEIGGIDEIGLGYNGDLSVFGISSNLRGATNAQAVPEPATTALILLALTALTLTRCRCRARARRR